MTDLIFSSSEVFVTNFKERRLLKRAKKAMVSELLLPEDSYEMTYEDECITNGGVNLITIPKEICTPIAGSVFAGVCFGLMTANIKVGVDVGLAAFIGSNYNSLKF